MKEAMVQPARRLMMDGALSRFSAPHQQLFKVYVLRIILLQNHSSYSLSSAPKRIRRHLKLERLQEALRS